MGDVLDYKKLLPGEPGWSEQAYGRVTTDEIAEDMESIWGVSLKALDGSNCVWRHQLVSIAKTPTPWGAHNLDPKVTKLLNSLVDEWVQEMAIGPFMGDIAEADNGGNDFEFAHQLIEQMLEWIWMRERLTETSQMSRIPYGWFLYAKARLIHVAKDWVWTMTQFQRGNER